jgi:membrane glycosyltransferase
MSGPLPDIPHAHTHAHAMPVPAPLDMQAQDFAKAPASRKVSKPPGRHWRLAVFGPACLVTLALVLGLHGWRATA